MNSNLAYMHGYCSPYKWFFNSFFLSPLSDTKLARQNKKEEENNHQTPKPNATTKHRNLAQKNIPKSIKKLTQNQRKSN